MCSPRGLDNALWHLQSNDGGEHWGAWESLGGSLTSGPGAASWSENRIDVFAHGTDGALWHRAYARRLAPVGRARRRTVGDPDVTTWGPNRLDVFVRGLRRLAVAHRLGVSDGSAGKASVVDSAPDPAADLGRGEQRRRLRGGTDGQLWSRRWNGAQWVNWFALGGGFFGDPDALATGSQVDVLVTGLDGSALAQDSQRHCVDRWFQRGLAVVRPAHARSGLRLIVAGDRGDDLLEGGVGQARISSSVRSWIG